MLLPFVAAIALQPQAQAQVTVPHYDLHARFDPQGRLDADVSVTLPPEMRDKSFLLARRFQLERMELPPGIIMASAEPTDTPVDGLYRYRFVALPNYQGPMRLRFHYSGPINPANDSGVRPMRPEGFELFIDHMWFPVGADITTRFTLNAEFEGLAPDLVPVGQGTVTRTPNGVRLERDYLDIDVPLVAMRGLNRAQAEGVEFFARDLNTPLSRFYIRHSENSARFFQSWFGPMTQTVRMAVVWRERSMAYARTGYTVFSEGGRSNPDIAEANPARHAAHEVAHVWWKLASPLTEDFWLVESAAQYSALRYIEATLGAAEAERFIAEMRRAAAQAGPVMGHGRPNRVQLYQKGPVILVDLEQRIGRPAMDRLMTEMAREPVHTHAIFLRLLTNIAGAEAATEFDRAMRT